MDSFGYTVHDGNGGQANGTATVTVESAENLPYYIEALISDHEAKRLNYPNDYGTGVIVTYTFLDAVPNYYSATSLIRNSFIAFSNQQEQIARDTLAQIESFTELTFIEVASADLATITFGLYDLGGDNLGVGMYPVGNSIGSFYSDLWLDTDLAGDTIIPGTEAYYVLLHEIGHAIGMDHPALPIAEDNRQYTVMDYSGHPTMAYGSDVNGYQLFDIAALQYLYGANFSYASSNDFYGFSEFDNVITTIWDAGGHDTFDMSAASYAVKIDLNPGTFSTVASNGSNNLAIAFGTMIEDAIGGSFADYIVSNAADNTFTGGAGNDTFVFKSNWGADVVTDFQSGQDKIDLSSDGLSFSDLTISTFGGNTEISYGANTILLLGVASVSAADFL